jgi:hypothetical protein
MKLDRSDRESVYQGAPDWKQPPEIAAEEGPLFDIDRRKLPFRIRPSPVNKSASATNIISLRP